MRPIEYFQNMEIVNKKRYDALRAFFFEKRSAREVALTYGYSLSSLYPLTRDFRRHLKDDPEEDFFFKEIILGRKEIKREDLEDMIIGLRKANFSVEDILGIVNSKGYPVSYGYVYKLLNNEGFARLPKRSTPEKKKLEFPRIQAPIASRLKMKAEKFQCGSTGLFAFLPFIREYGIDQLIDDSSYPG